MLEKTILHIDEEGNVLIPNSLINCITNDMLLVKLTKDTLLITTLNNLENINSSMDKKTRNNLLRVLKANSTRIKITDNKFNIPDYILNEISSNDFIITISPSSIKLTNIELVNEGNYGKKI